ncbi:MAG: glycosyltransferase family 4 protein [Candidatus Omnitrophica bacterium]|nr:glycosyltransferase family 4 protein [Candidatus Omnitrophota bacterium]
MNIAFMTEYFSPFVIGGAELSAYALARELTGRGHSVTVVTPNYGAREYEEIGGIRIYRIAFPQKLKPGDQARSFFMHSVFMQLYFARCLVRICRRHKIEVIHAQHTNAIIPAFVAAAFTRCRSVVTLRDFHSITAGSVLWLNRRSGEENIQAAGGYFRSAFRFQKFFNPDQNGFARLKAWCDIIYRWPDLRLRQFCLRRFDTVIGVSENLRALYFENGFACLKGRFRVLYNIPPDCSRVPYNPEGIKRKYVIPEDARVVLWAGRRTPAKGFDVFLRGIPLVRDRLSDVCFVVAGRGLACDESLQSISAIRDLGVLPNQEILKLMTISDVVVVPSQWDEPLSRTMIEALSMGRPVIGTSAGGTPELISDGENGFLIRPGDAGDLAEKIALIISDRELQKRLSLRAIESIRRICSPERITDEVLAVYRGDQVVQRSQPETASSYIGRL